MHDLNPIPIGHTNFLNKTGVLFFKLIYFVLPLFLIFSSLTFYLYLIIHFIQNISLNI
jgi:hypothetical protein